MKYQIKNILIGFRFLLEKLDKKRDQILFIFIKKYWPKKITPNHLTYLRLIISVFLFVLLFYFGIVNKFLIIFLFIVGILTDLFDGSVARCLKMETNFGAMLDPIADRMIIIPIAIYSLISTHRWLLLVLIVLEIINGLIHLIQQSNNIFTSANVFAKVKMVLHSIVFAIILITWPKSISIFIIDILWLSIIFSILSLFFKVIEGKHPKLNKNVNIKIKKYET